MARVVVGVDGSEHSRRALRRAVEEARIRGANVEAVYVFPPPDRSLTEAFVAWPHAMDTDAEGRTAEQRYESGIRRAEDGLAQFVQEAIGDARPRPELVAIPDAQPAGALIEHSEGADLLVIGTRGHGGFRGMLIGSVAQQCAQHGRCPVLILPPGI